MSTLIERLRFQHEYTIDLYTDDARPEAATRIEELEAEVKHLNHVLDQYELNMKAISTSRLLRDWL